jgi:hypothetical protein
MARPSINAPTREALNWLAERFIELDTKLDTKANRRRKKPSPTVTKDKDPAA